MRLDTMRRDLYVESELCRRTERFIKSYILRGISRCTQMSGDLDCSNIRKRGDKSDTSDFRI